VVLDPVPPVQVTWSISKPRSDAPFLPCAIVGRCSRVECGRHVYYGDPDAAVHFPFQHSHGSDKPEVPPQSVIDAYKAARIECGVLPLSRDAAAATIVGRHQHLSDNSEIKDKNGEIVHFGASGLTLARLAEQNKRG